MTFTAAVRKEAVFCKWILGPSGAGIRVNPGGEQILAAAHYLRGMRPLSPETSFATLGRTECPHGIVPGLLRSSR
jgi:hypothetical protein